MTTTNNKIPKLMIFQGHVWKIKVMAHLSSQFKIHIWTFIFDINELYNIVLETNFASSIIL